MFIPAHETHADTVAHACNPGAATDAIVGHICVKNLQSFSTRKLYYLIAEISFNIFDNRMLISIGHKFVK